MSFLLSADDILVSNIMIVIMNIHNDEWACDLSKVQQLKCYFDISYD